MFLSYLLYNSAYSAAVRNTTRHHYDVILLYGSRADRFVEQRGYLLDVKHVKQLRCDE